jgi:hypothetical protein
MQFWYSWQFFAVVVLVFAWAVYGLIGTARRIGQHRATSAAPPDKPLTWRVAGYALFCGGPAILAIPCLLKQLGVELAGVVVAVLLIIGVLDVLAGGFFLITADRTARR